MNSIEGTKGWYNRYVMHLKGACRWCDGSGKAHYTMKAAENQISKLPPHHVECPRCGGSGDEPAFNRKAI